MDKIESRLKMWCLGFGIDPEVTDRPDAQEALKRKDGLAVYEVITRHGKALSGLKMDRPNRNSHLLECQAIVNDNEEGFLLAALLGGEKLR